MTSRFSRNATPSCSDEGSGLYPGSSSFASQFDVQAPPSGSAREHIIGQGQGLLNGLSLKIVWLCAALVLVPAIIVASWFQYRVVGGLESQLTSIEARNLAAKMDGVIDARASALRMAAGSLEIENLAASGGLNRLLGGLKDLFPDFRSLEIFTEQGQPLAMMGELSLETVRKHSGMRKGARHEPELVSEPVFKDTPAADCFFITMKHQGPDKSVWFSRARFSREAVTAVLEPQRVDRNAHLVSNQPQVPTDTKAASDSPAASASNEPAATASGAWGTRSFFAQAPLDTPDWKITLERRVPVSKLSYLALFMGGLLFAGSGIILLKSKKSGNAPITAQAAAVPELEDVISHMEDGEEPLPDASDLDPDVSEAFAQALAREAIVHADDAETADTVPAAEKSDILGPAGAPSLFAEEDDAFLDGRGAIREEERCDPFVGLQEELDLTEQGIELSDTGTFALEPSDDTTEEPEVAEIQTAEMAADEAAVVEFEEMAESVAIGDPIQLDNIPDTLEVCWNESSEEDAQAAEQSGEGVVDRWYPTV